MSITERLLSKETVVGLSLIAVGGLMAGYGEQMQRHLELYWQARALFGTGLANVFLGQFGDIGYPAIVGSGIGTLSAVLFSKNKEGMKRLATLFTITGGLFMGIYYLGLEVNSALDPNTLTTCGNPNSFCPGDIQDGIALSIPIVATGIYSIKQLASRHK